MSKLDSSQEQYLLSAIKQDNEEAFSLIFQSYYVDLVLFGGNFIKNEQVVDQEPRPIHLFEVMERKKEHSDRNLIKIFPVKICSKQLPG